MRTVKTLFVLCICVALFGETPSWGKSSVLDPSFLRDQKGGVVSDSSLFGHLVTYVREVGLWRKNPEALAFDPRVIDSLQQPTSVTKANLVLLPSAHLRKRIRTLRRLEANKTDILKDVECLFSGGLPALDSMGVPRSKSSRCEEKGAFTSVIFGRRRPEQDCPFSKSREAKVGEKCVAIRAIEISQYSFFVYELKVFYRPDEGWRVLDKTQVSGIAS